MGDRLRGLIGGWYWLAIAVTIFIAACEPAGGRSGLLEDVRFDRASVTEVRRFPGHAYNIVSLRGSTPTTGIYEADFVQYFERTGGLERWGHPISELFEERPGVLVQYFQSGVVEYRPHRGFQVPRLWNEFILGSESGSQLAGAERAPSNGSPGERLGRWGRKISNFSVEGEEVGFAEAFRRLGGVMTLGYPLSDARRDSHPQARLGLLDDKRKPVRQYFEGAVLEWHPGTAFPIRVVPLGSWIRDIRYETGEWVELLPFRRTVEIKVGGDYPAELLRFAENPLRVGAGNGVVVGIGTHPYAIAYHPQGHLIYREGDGWYSLLYDGVSGVLTFVSDGVGAVQRSEVVTHEKVGPGLALYDWDGVVHVMYADLMKRRIYLRTGDVRGGEARLGEPVVVAEWHDEFMAYLATEAMGSDGLPRVLVRSYQGVTMGTGTISHLWLTTALDDSFEDWRDPIRITTQADAERATAGTSGSLGVVGERIVIVFNMADELMAFVGSVDEPGGLVRESLGGAAGIHDHILLVRDGVVHLAYHAPGKHGTVMAFRTWTEDGGWSQRIDLAATGDHATAMTVDEVGNVWVFFGTGSSVRMRVRRVGRDSFDAERCVVNINPLEAASYVWLGAAQPAGKNETGLLWTQRPADDRWEVRFKVIGLEDFDAAPLCRD